MNTKRFIRNYSQNDLRRLIYESEKRAQFINRIIDGDIHLRMDSERNSPLKEKYKYLRKKNDINLENSFQPRTERTRLNNYNNLNLSNSGLYENRKIQKEENYYNNKYNNLYMSLNLNKPFHREKRHFPYINNIGNFFKKENQFLLKRKVINKNNFSFINNDNHKNPRTRRLIRYDYYNKEENNSNRYDNSVNYKSKNFQRSNSMANMSNDYQRYNNNENNNKIYNLLFHNIQKRDNRFQDGKHYSPFRYDYENSRCDDKTYNYLLKEPMRGDISLDWKFPPLYCYKQTVH